VRVQAWILELRWEIEGENKKTIGKSDFAVAVVVICADSSPKLIFLCSLAFCVRWAFDGFQCFEGWQASGCYGSVGSSNKHAISDIKSVAHFILLIFRSLF
jgi:hypothetical protein